MQGARVVLDLGLEAFTPEELEAAGIDWRGFLRERGLDLAPEGVELYESRVTPEDEVEVIRHGSPAVYTVRRPTGEG